MQAHVQAAVESDIHFARSLSSMAYGESSVPMTCTSRFLVADDDDDDDSDVLRHDKLDAKLSAEAQRREEAEAAANRENPTRTAIGLTTPVYHADRDVICTTIRFSREMPFMGDLARGLSLTGALSSPHVSSGVPGSGGGGGTGAGGGVATSTVLGSLLGPTAVGSASAAAHAAQAPLLVGVVCLEASFGPRYPLERCQWRLLSSAESQPFVAAASADAHMSADGKGGPGTADGEGGAGSGFTVSLGITADMASEYVGHAAAMSLLPATAPTTAARTGGPDLSTDESQEGGEAAQPAVSATEAPPVPERERLHILLQPHVAARLLHWLPVTLPAHRDSAAAAATAPPPPPPPDPLSMASQRPITAAAADTRAGADGEAGPLSSAVSPEASWPTSFLRDFVSLVRGWVSLELDEAALHVLSLVPAAAQTAADHHAIDSPRHSPLASPVPEPGPRSGGGGGAMPFPARPAPAITATTAAMTTATVPPTHASVADAVSAGASASRPLEVDTARNSTNASVTVSSAVLAAHDVTHMESVETRARLAQTQHRRRLFRACLLPQGGLVAWGCTSRGPDLLRAASEEDEEEEGGARGRGPPRGLPPVTSGASLTTCSSARQSISHSAVLSPMGADELHAPPPPPTHSFPSPPPPPQLAYPPWVYAFYKDAARPLRTPTRLLPPCHRPDAVTTSTASSLRASQPPAPAPQQQQQHAQQQPPLPSETWPWSDWLSSLEAAPRDPSAWPASAGESHFGHAMGDDDGATDVPVGLGLEDIVVVPRTAKLLLTSRFYTDGGLLPTMLREPAFVFGTHRRSCRWTDVNLTLEGEAHLAMHAASKLCKALHLDTVAHLLSTLRRLAKAMTTTYYSMNVSLSHKHGHGRARKRESPSTTTTTNATTTDDARHRDGEALNSYVNEMIGPVLRETVKVLQQSHQPFWAGVAVCGIVLPCLLRDGSRSDRDGASSAAAYSHAFGLGNVSVEDTDLLAPFLHHAGVFGDYISVVGLVERVLALVGQETKRCEARIVRRALERALYAKLRPRATAALASTDASVDLYLRYQRMKGCYSHPMTARHAPIHACAVCGLSLLDRAVTSTFDGGNASVSPLGPVTSWESLSPNVVIGVRSGMKHGEENTPEGCLVLQCMRCGHGGHVEHLMAWWADPDVRGCPKGCDCECIY